MKNTILIIAALVLCSGCAGADYGPKDAARDFWKGFTSGGCGDTKNVWTDTRGYTVTRTCSGDYIISGYDR